MNRGQEFVIGGYFPGAHGFDSLIVGYYDGDKLMYVARTRNGFVPASGQQVFSKLKHLVTPACPFVNLPEIRRSRFGEELNAEKMKNAVWLRPEAVVQTEFREWTEADRLRHSKFVGLREDKNPRGVVKEQAGEPWISSGYPVTREQSPVTSTNQTCGLCVYMRAAEGFRSPYTFMRACSKEGLPVTCSTDYSYLKATIGSTCIARRAGT